MLRLCVLCHRARRRGRSTSSLALNRSRGGLRRTSRVERRTSTRAHRRSLARNARVYRERPHHATTRRRAGVQRRGDRGDWPTPTGSTATSGCVPRLDADTSWRLSRFPTWMCAIATCSRSSSGSARNDAQSSSSTKVASTGSTSTACAPPSKRSSSTSIASIRQRRDEPANVTRASISRRRGPGVRVRPGDRVADRARTRSSRSCSNFAVIARLHPRQRRRERGRAVLRRAERAARASRRGVLPTHVPANVSSWNCAILTCEHHRRLDHPSESRFGAHQVVVWRTTHTWAMPAQRQWAPAASSTLVSWPRAIRDAAMLIGFSTDTGTSPPRRTGAVRPNANVFARRTRTATKRCCTRRHSPVLAANRDLARTKSWRALVSSERSVSSTDRDRVAEPLLRGQPDRAVRRGDPPRSHAGPGTARNDAAVGCGRTLETFPRPVAT